MLQSIPKKIRRFGPTIPPSIKSTELVKKSDQKVQNTEYTGIWHQFDDKNDQQKHVKIASPENINFNDIQANSSQLSLLKSVDEIQPETVKSVIQLAQSKPRQTDLSLDALTEKSEELMRYTFKLQEQEITIKRLEQEKLTQELLNQQLKSAERDVKEAQKEKENEVENTIQTKSTAKEVDKSVTWEDESKLSKFELSEIVERQRAQLQKYKKHSDSLQNQLELIEVQKQQQLKLFDIHQQSQIITKQQNDDLLKQLNKLEIREEALEKENYSLKQKISEFEFVTSKTQLEGAEQLKIVGQELLTAESLLSSTKNALQITEKRCEKLQAQFSLSQAEKEQIQKMFNELNQTNQVQQKELSQLTEKFNQMEVENQNMKHQIDFLHQQETELKQLEATVQHFELQNMKLQSQHELQQRYQQQQDTQIAEIVKLNSTLNSQLQKAQEENLQMQIEFERINESKRNGLQEFELQDLKNKVTKSSAELLQKDAKIQKLDELVKFLQENYKDVEVSFNESLKDLEMKNLELKQQNLQLNQKIANLENQQTEVNLFKQQTQEDINQKDKQIALLKSELQKAQTEIQAEVELQQQISLLSNIISEKEQFNSVLQKEAQKQGEQTKSLLEQLQAEIETKENQFLLKAKENLNLKEQIKLQTAEISKLKQQEAQTELKNSQTRDLCNQLQQKQKNESLMQEKELQFKQQLQQMKIIAKELENLKLNEQGTEIMKRVTFLDQRVKKVQNFDVKFKTAVSNIINFKSRLQQELQEKSFQIEQQKTEIEEMNVQYLQIIEQYQIELEEIGKRK